MIQTNTVNCSIQELAKIALEHNLYVSDNWCLKGILTRILNNDHTDPNLGFGSHTEPLNPLEWLF